MASCPDINESTLDWFMSKPIVLNFVENNLARGRPTYPRPMTQTLISFENILYNVISFNYFHILRPDEGGGDGEHAGDFDHDAARFADADYLAFDAGEGAGFYLDALAFTEFGTYCGHVDEVFVQSGRDLDEVFHRFGRDHHWASAGAFPVEMDRGVFAI